MNVTYDYYRIFYYVAKYHSFTRAAQAMGSSQPNVTRAMNNLEHELGCRLFQRTHRGVTLTPEGEGLFAHIRIAQEHIAAGEAELTQASQLERGRVTVGASEIALHGLLLDTLRQFHHTYPGIHIQVTNQSTPQAVQAVRTGAVDLAVVTTPTGVTGKPLREVKLLPYREILIAGPGFRDLREKTLSLTELFDYPLIALSRDTKTYEVYEGLFARHGQDLRPDIEVATVDQVLPMVQYDLGLGFLPTFFAEEAIQTEKVFEVRLKEEIPQRAICLVWDQSRPLSAAAAALERMIREKK